MDRHQRDRQYFSAGVRASIAWLHKQADAMNDPHAKAILNSAAFQLGVEKGFGRLSVPSEPAP